MLKIHFKSMQNIYYTLNTYICLNNYFIFKIYIKKVIIYVFSKPSIYRSSNQHNVCLLKKLISSWCTCRPTTISTGFECARGVDTGKDGCHGDG